MLWEMVNLCGLKRDTLPPRHCFWPHISPGRVGDAGSNEVKVSPGEPHSVLGVNKSCQFSALGTPYESRDGERTVVLGREMGRRKRMRPESTRVGRDRS